MAIIDELLVGLGFEFNEKDLDSFQKSVDQSKAILGKFIKVTFVATAAIGALLKTSATATDNITKQAKQVNVLTSEYDALLFASEITTGNSQNMAGALQNLSVRASEASRGVGSGVEAFGMLGVSVTDANGKLKTTDVLLSETAEALNGLSDQGQRLELADKLGLREIDLLLREGAGGIKKLTDEAKVLGTITEADAKAAEDFNDAQSRMVKALDTVRRTIATGILPQFQKVIDAFTEWLKANKKVIKQRFDKFIKVLAKVLTGLGKIFGVILGAIDKFIDAVGGLDNALKLLLITFAAIAGSSILLSLFKFIKLMRTAGTAALVMNAKMLLIPILIGAAIAVLGLLIDDILTFINGGDSLIGRMLEKFPLLNNTFLILKDTVSSVWEFIQKLGEGIGIFIAQIVIGVTNLIEGVAEVIKDVSLFGTMLSELPLVQKAIDLIKNTFSEILGIVTSIGEGVGKFVGGTIESVTKIIEDPLGSAGDLLNKLNPFSDDSQTDSIPTLAEGLSSDVNPFSNEAPASAGSSISNINNTDSNTTTQKIEQTNSFTFVGDNPKAVGEEVKKVMEELIGTGIRNTVSVVDV